MIRGTDVSIATRAGPESLDLAVRLAKRLWPRAVFEDAQTGIQCEHLADLALDQTPELLIYRDRRTAEQWAQHGAVPELAGTLIHLLLQKDSLTIVLDADAHSQLLNYVETSSQRLTT